MNLSGPPHTYSWKLNCVVLAFVTAVCVGSYILLDVHLLKYFDTYRDTAFRQVFEILTRLGISTPYLVISAAAFVWLRFVKKDIEASNSALFIFLAIAVSGILNNILKVLIGRYRPILFFNEQLYGLKFFAVGYAYNSFPSGHANTVAALFCSLYLLLGGPRLIYPILAIPIIMSRVVIGAHYFSDVLFGSYLAVVTTFFLREVFRKKGLHLWRRLGREEQ